MAAERSSALSGEIYANSNGAVEIFNNGVA